MVDLNAVASIGKSLQLASLNRLNLAQCGVVTDDASGECVYCGCIHSASSVRWQVINVRGRFGHQHLVVRSTAGVESTIDWAYVKQAIADGLLELN